MIIDSHLHLKDDIYVGEEGTPENIIRMMKKTEIDKVKSNFFWKKISFVRYSYRF